MYNGAVKKRLSLKFGQFLNRCEPHTQLSIGLLSSCQRSYTRQQSAHLKYFIMVVSQISIVLHLLYFVNAEP